MHDLDLNCMLNLIWQIFAVFNVIFWRNLCTYQESSDLRFMESLRVYYKVIWIWFTFLHLGWKKASSGSASKYPKSGYRIYVKLKLINN